MARFSPGIWVMHTYKRTHHTAKPSLILRARFWKGKQATYERLLVPRRKRTFGGISNEWVHLNRCSGDCPQEPQLFKRQGGRKVRRTKRPHSIACSVTWTKNTCRRRLKCSLILQSDERMHFDIWNWQGEFWKLWRAISVEFNRAPLCALE